MWIECLAIDYQGLWNIIPQLAEEIMVDPQGDFWMRETGTGQQVAQLHERMMKMMMTYLHKQHHVINFGTVLYKVLYKRIIR